MEGKLLATMDSIIVNVIKNKKIFRKWFIICSKWLLTFIQRGYAEKEGRDKEERKEKDEKWNKGKGKRTIAWWCKNKEELMKEWEGNGWVYALLSNMTGDWYIGSTKRSMDDRLREHLYETGRVWEKDKMEQTALHKSMWRIGPKNWMMVPLLRVDDENELRKAERCLITKMKPNLNRRVTGNREKGKLRKQPPKKGRVNNKGETKDEGKKKKETFWTWVYDGKETMDFGGVIEKTKTPIIWQRGTIDMTEWDTLEEKYQIEASIDQDFGDLNFLKKKMRKNEIGMFRIMSCIRKDKEKEKRIRKMIKEGLDKVKDDELIWIWRKRELFKRSERAKITRKVNKEMEKRRGMPIPKNMILKIPPTEEVGKREIKKDIDRWLSKIGIGKQWKKWLQKETKVTEV